MCRDAPPIAEVIAGVIAHYLTFDRLPELTNLDDPRLFTIIVFMITAIAGLSLMPVCLWRTSTMMEPNKAGVCTRLGVRVRRLIMLVLLPNGIMGSAILLNPAIHV